MADRRESPYVWVTWLRDLLTGELTCEWSAWYRAHYSGIARKPVSADLAVWRREHADLVRIVAQRLVDEGYSVTTEEQNSWKLKDRKRGITLAGNPDIPAIRGGDGLLVEVKTGLHHDHDVTQLLTYLWMGNLHPAPGGATPSGVIEYPDGRRDIAMPAGFSRAFVDLLVRVSEDNPAERVPSPGNCFLCPLTRSDCAVRIDASDDRPHVVDFDDS